MEKVFRIVTVIAILALVGGLMGCATQKKVGTSGFLGTYPQFEPGKEGIDKRYIKEGVDLKKYNKVMMDEVVFYFHSSADYEGIRPSEIKELSDEFHKIFVDTLGDLLTDKPGPDVVRMRLAVTDLEPSKTGLSAVTTVVPVGLAFNLIKKGAGGEYTGIGSASMEVEFLDSMTNERVAAAIDHAPGGKMDMGKLSAVKSAFEFWAERLKTFMDNLPTM
jgi:hypothetical protein